MDNAILVSQQAEKTVFCMYQHFTLSVICPLSTILQCQYLFK